MTKSLIKKEFALTAHPMTFVMALFGMMLLIPSYSYFIAFFYTTLGIFFDYINARENKDYIYMAVLPVSKKDIVKAKSIFVIIIELVSVFFAIPFAIISVRINPNPNGNIAGIEANVAFFGLVLIMYAIFNLVFLTSFFKTAYKVGKAFIFACTGMAALIIVVEGGIHIPVIGAFLDVSDTATQMKQLPILAAGIVIYIIFSLVSVKKSTSNFEKVDL